MRILPAVLVLGLALAAPVVAAPAAPIPLPVGDSNGPDGDPIAATDLTVTASTTLCEKKPKLCHGPELLLDRDAATAWCEGLPGDGVGATVTFTFKKPEKLSGLFVLPQFAKTFALAEANGRLQTIEIATDGATFTADFDDLAPIVRKKNPVKEDNDDCGDETCLSRDQRISMYGQYVTFGHYAKGDSGDFTAAPVTTTKLVITLRAAYKGKRFPRQLRVAARHPPREVTAAISGILPSWIVRAGPRESAGVASWGTIWRSCPERPASA